MISILSKIHEGYCFIFFLFVFFSFGVFGAAPFAVLSMAAMSFNEIHPLLFLAALIWAIHSYVFLTMMLNR